MKTTKHSSVVKRFKEVKNDHLFSTLFLCPQSVGSGRSYISEGLLF